MAVNIFRDELQHAQLFGTPVLTTNWLLANLIFHIAKRKTLKLLRCL